MTISNHRHHPYNNEEVPEGKRLRMRDWLISRIGDPRYPGLTWVDKKEMIFSIPWKHAALHGWNQESDGALFRDWSKHTGACVRNAAPKQLKATFRCALHSLPDVHEIKDRAKKRGDDACRVFQIDMNPMTPHVRKKLIRIRNHNKEKNKHRVTEKQSPVDDFQSRPHLDTTYEWMQQLQQQQEYRATYDEFQIVQDFNKSQTFGCGNGNTNSNNNNNCNVNCADNLYQVTPNVYPRALTEKESFGSASPAQSSYNAQSNSDIPHMLLPSPVEVSLTQSAYSGVGDSSPFHRNWYSNTDNNSVPFSPPDSTYSSGSMTSSPMPLSPQQPSYSVNPLSPTAGSMDATIAQVVGTAAAIMREDCANSNRSSMSPVEGYYNQNVGFDENLNNFIILNPENMFDDGGLVSNAHPIQLHQHQQQRSPTAAQETYSFVVQEKETFPSVTEYEDLFKGQDNCRNEILLVDNQMQQKYSSFSFDTVEKTHHMMENVNSSRADMCGVQLDSGVGVESLGADESPTHQHWGNENCHTQHPTLPSASTLLTPSNSPNSSIASIPIQWTNTPRPSPTELGYDMQFQTTIPSDHGRQQAFMTTSQSTTECFTCPDPSYYCNTGSYQPATSNQCPNPSPTSPSYVYGGTR